MAEIIIPEKFIPGGQTIGRQSNNKKVLIWGALPGESITNFKINKSKTHYLDITALDINNSSPYRVEPKDNIFLSTSPWQIIDYNYELKIKQEIIVEIFREHNINIDTPEIITDGKDYYYRNKMEYSLFWDNNQNIIKLAFHERGTHRKIPINTSSIERPEIFEYAKQIINKLNKRGEEARKYQSLLLRCNQAGEVSGGLYENNQPHPKFNNLTDKILGYNYSYSPNGFFQINLPVYEMALKEIKKHINTDKVLDLYAGVGTIGLSVAHNKNLTLVEVDKFAFSELKTNCSVFKDNILNTRQAILAKSEEVLDYIEPDQTVILDPPRAGCDKKLINKLSETKPTLIVYLSCNPSTQARDVKLLLDNYKIKVIKTYNFFPHTPHIENLVVLERN